MAPRCLRTSVDVRYMLHLGASVTFVRRYSNYPYRIVYSPAYDTQTEGSIASKGNNLQIGRSECYENLSVASRCVASSTGLARQEYSLSFYTNVKRIRWEVWKHLMKRTREARRRDGKRMTRRWRTVNGGWRTRRETARARARARGRRGGGRGRAKRKGGRASRR